MPVRLFLKLDIFETGSDYFNAQIDNETIVK
jgi:hypothetical protein